MKSKWLGIPILSLMLFHVETTLAQTHSNAAEVIGPAGNRWSAQLGTTLTEFSPAGRTNWSDYLVSVRRYFEHASLAAEGLRASRFGLQDSAWALDAYADVWQRSYVNLRYQRNEDGVLYPKDAWRAELFQGIAGAWELSAGYDRLEFSTTNVDLYGLGVAKYIGNFYLRWKHLFTRTSSSDGQNDQLLARYYYRGNGDDYLELRAGTGKSTEDLSGTPGVTATRRNSQASVAWVYYPSVHWGFKVGASYGDEAGMFVGRGALANLYTRW